MKTRYRYTYEGEVQGPVDSASLDVLFRGNHINGFTAIQKEGFEGWTSYAELFPLMLAEAAKVTPHPFICSLLNGWAILQYGGGIYAAFLCWDKDNIIYIFVSLAAILFGIVLSLISSYLAEVAVKK